MKPKSDSPQSGKPRVALAIATGFGLGYLPLAPGTWGSLGGITVVYGIWLMIPLSLRAHSPAATASVFQQTLLVAVMLTAVVGVPVAGQAAKHFATKDPQAVVIDESCGQLITFLGAAPLGPSMLLARYMTWHSPVNWEYLLLGFILFRVFDIWKPFPARQAEKLPGGWGIMADDWVAGLYAALGLWLARVFGL